MPLLYKAADIAVCASTEPRAFGLVAIEAQAVETGMIATAHGGSLESVIDGETGFLVEPSNPTALKAAVTKALSDLRTCAGMGKAGRVHVYGGLTEQAICQREAAVYIARCRSAAEKSNGHNVV